MPSYEGDSVTNPDGITHLRQMNTTLSSTIAFNWLQQNHDGHVLVSEHACVQLRLTSVWVLSSPTTTASKWLHGPRTYISDASTTTASTPGRKSLPSPCYEVNAETDSFQKNSTSSGNIQLATRSTSTLIHTRSIAHPQGTSRIFMVVGHLLGSFCAR